MIVDWNRIEPWDYVVNSVASEYHRKFPMVELADIRQSLYQWFAEHPNKLDEWEAIGEKDAKNLIYRSLRNDALDYCQRWKAKTIGYETDDVYYYESDIVEALLGAVLRGEYNITHKLDLGRPGTPVAPNEGGNLQVMMFEIEAAYWKLSKDDKKLLFFRYAESSDYKEIANLLSLGSEDAARMRHNRAIKRLVDKLGGYKPFHDVDTTKTEDTEDNEELHSDSIE